MKIKIIKGGKGSGNFGHPGIPGHQGGAGGGQSSGAGATSESDAIWDEKLKNKMHDFLEDQKIKQSRKARDDRQKLINQMEEAMRSRDAGALLKLQAELASIKD